VSIATHKRRIERPPVPTSGLFGTGRRHSGLAVDPHFVPATVGVASLPLPTVITVLESLAAALLAIQPTGRSLVNASSGAVATGGLFRERESGLSVRAMVVDLPAAALRFVLIATCRQRLGRFPLPWISGAMQPVYPRSNEPSFNKSIANRNAQREKQ